MFTIAGDGHLKLLRVKLAGFFSIEEVGDFARAAQATVAQMGCGSGGYLHLCDISEMMLQSQDVAGVFAPFINSPKLKSRRLAIVTGNASVRMQIKRVLIRPDARLFASATDAEAWLLDGVEETFLPQRRPQHMSATPVHTAGF